MTFGFIYEEEVMPVFSIYRTTCLINTEFYLGQHKTNDPNDSYLGSGTRIRRLVQKYGKQNFKKQVLHYFQNKGEADAKEIELISAEQGNPLCLNLARGGEGGWEFVNSSGVVQRSWKENGAARARSISIAVEKKWSDPIHRKIHEEANKRPSTKKKQQISHKKQWEKISRSDRLKIGLQRRQTWRMQPEERKIEWKKKVSLARLAHFGIDREAVIRFTLAHPEMSYRVIGENFSISSMTVGRICKEHGVKRKSGTRPGSKRA